jgi:hypothetical protein
MCNPSRCFSTSSGTAEKFGEPVLGWSKPVLAWVFGSVGEPRLEVSRYGPIRDTGTFD